VVHFVALQKQAKFLLKIDSAMMLRLVGDIGANLCCLRETDGEDAVTILPSQNREESDRLLIQRDELRSSSLTIAAGRCVRRKGGGVSLAGEFRYDGRNRGEDGRKLLKLCGY
jgi:hypothetical protein